AAAEADAAAGEVGVTAVLLVQAGLGAPHVRVYACVDLHRVSFAAVAEIMGQLLVRSSTRHACGKALLKPRGVAVAVASRSAAPTAASSSHSVRAAILEAIA